jgi:hypothetical protein
VRWFSSNHFSQALWLVKARIGAESVRVDFVAFVAAFFIRSMPSD